MPVSDPSRRVRRLVGHFTVTLFRRCVRSLSPRLHRRPPARAVTGCGTIPAMNPLAGLTMGACAGVDFPRQAILGIATHAGTAVAVGGQGWSVAAVTDDGRFFRTIVPPGRGLRGALLRDDGLWVVGEYGHISRSDDGGRSWRQLASGTSGCLFGVVADAGGRLWVAGDDGYLASSADGDTFRRVRGVAESIGRIGAGAVGVLVPTDRPGRLYTCHGKGTVTRLNLEAGVDLMSATTTPTGAIVTVGASGAVFRSDDGGDSFTRVTVPGGGLLAAVRCLPDGRVVIVGAGGLVLVSGDDGRSFARYDQFVSAATLWCCEPFGDGLLIGDGNGVVSWLGEQRTASPRATTAERRDGLFLSPWLLTALHPRRGGIPVPIRPLPAPDAAWATLRRALWASDRHAMVTRGSRSGIWDHATSDHHERRAIGERLLDPRPRAASVADDVRLVELVFERYRSFVGAFREDVEERLADFLVASLGLPEAARRLLAGLRSELPYTGVGPFGRLRELLVLADDAAYAEARSAIFDAAAAELARTPDDDRRCAHLRWTTTFLLPLGPAAGDEEGRAHRDALRHLGEFGNSRVHASALAAGDLGTLERLMESNRKNGHQFFSPFHGGRMYLASVPEVAGGAAAALIARLKPGDPWQTDPFHNDLWCRLLAHLDDERALDALLAERRAGHAWGTAGLLRAASLAPERVRAFARANGDAELEALMERGFEPEPSRSPLDDDTTFAGLGDPVGYVPPPASRGAALETALAISPDQSWRDEEAEAARRVGAAESSATWNGVSLARCDDAALEEFVAHRERWAVPTSVADLALTPVRLHGRLMALGFTFDHSARYGLIPVLRRGGVSHLPLLLAALAEPDTVELALAAAQPFGDVSIVPAVVKAFAGKKHKALARSWIVRHPRHAAAGALTMGGADPGAARVLRYLDSRGHRATIMGFAAELGVGPDARALLDADPLTAPGVKRPVVPAFAAASTLPTLDVDADLLLVQLAWSNADEVHPGVLAAKATGAPAALAAFAWALFEAWLAAGAPAREAWCLQAVGLLGDDDCARRLTVLARRWPGENASARAHAALDALLNIGTDTALININLLAEKSRYPAFAAAARERIDAIAHSRGLTADELADRLVPTLGLDEDGADVVDTGARVFRIGFDAGLMPVLRDESGAVLADVPRPGKNDDKQKVKTAKSRLAALRKDARASASLHLSRIERAMCAGRPIGAEVFLDRYARHPWMRHVASRLVWGSVVDFRVAEDGTLADIDDKLFELPVDSPVVVRHPLDLAADEVAGWSELFADYEILQPFPQLARPVFRASDTDLAAFTGRTVTYGQLRGLETRGWSRWLDSSVQMVKRLGGDTYAALDTDPGWHASDTAESVGPQRVEGVRFHGGTVADVAPREYSELVYDLHRLV